MRPRSYVKQMREDGAAGPTRTDDLTLTKRLLYQLSYSGMENDRGAGFYQNGDRLPLRAAHRYERIHRMSVP